MRFALRLAGGWLFVAFAVFASPGRAFDGARWTVTINGTIDTIATDRAGDIFLRTIERLPTPAVVRVSVLKLTPKGALAWKTSFDSSDANPSQGRHFAVTAAGETYVPILGGDSNGGRHFWLIDKMEPDGRHAWSRTIAPGDPQQLSCIVRTDRTGACYAAACHDDHRGPTLQLGSLSREGATRFIASFPVGGVWGSQTGDENLHDISKLSSFCPVDLSVADDGSCVVHGLRYCRNDGREGPWELLRVDHEGQLVWTVSDGGAQGFDRLSAGECEPNGDVIAVGELNGRWGVRRYHSQGRLLWEHVLASPSGYAGSFGRSLIGHDQNTDSWKVLGTELRTEYRGDVGFSVAEDLTIMYDRQGRVVERSRLPGLSLMERTRVLTAVAPTPDGGLLLGMMDRTSQMAVLMKTTEESLATATAASRPTRTLSAGSRPLP